MVRTTFSPAYVPQHLRGQFTLGIEAFGFFLEIDATQIHGPDAVRGFSVRLARDPAEGARRFAFGQQLARVGLGNARHQGDGSGKIGHFRRYGEHRIHRNRHRQFASGAVVDDSPLRGNFGSALLLVLGSLLEVAVTEDLQIDQAQANGSGPEHKHCAQQVKPFVRVVAGCARRHRLAP